MSSCTHDCSSCKSDCASRDKKTSFLKPLHAGATVRKVIAVASGKGGRIPVDYCKIKFVKKPPKAKAGFVIYTDYKTLLVDPLELSTETPDKNA